jgi:host factor-I protein
MVNRKLIRPNLAEIKGKLSARPGLGEQPPPREQNGVHPRRRMAPPELTSAEAFYYLKQMNGKTPMVVVLGDGEELRGHIEWYDRNCLKVHRPNQPNLLVFKHSIKYLYKQEDERPDA